MKNPQAVLDVLEFYTDTQKQQSQDDMVWSKFSKATPTSPTPGHGGFSKSGHPMQPLPGLTEVARMQRPGTADKQQSQPPGRPPIPQSSSSSSEGRPTASPAPPVAPRPQHTLSIYSVDKQSGSFCIFDKVYLLKD